MQAERGHRFRTKPRAARVANEARGSYNRTKRQAQACVGYTLAVREGSSPAMHAVMNGGPTWSHQYLIAFFTALPGFHMRKMQPSIASTYACTCSLQPALREDGFGQTWPRQFCLRDLRVSEACFEPKQGFDVGHVERHGETRVDCIDDFPLRLVQFGPGLFARAGSLSQLIQSIPCL